MVRLRAGGRGEQKGCPRCAPDTLTQSWWQPVCQPRTHCLPWPEQCCSCSPAHSTLGMRRAERGRGRMHLPSGRCCQLWNKHTHALGKEGTEVQAVLQVKSTLLMWGIKGISTEGWQDLHLTVTLLYFYYSDFPRSRTRSRLCHYTKLWAEASGMTLRCLCTGAPSATIPIHIVSPSLSSATCAGAKAQVFQV